MLRRAFVLLACCAALAVPPAPAKSSIYESFNYWVTNQTNNGAVVRIYHRFAPAFHLTLVASGWVNPGGRISLRLPKQETTYELEAIFKKGGESSADIGSVTTKWWLTNGSKDRLVNENGRFYWKPF
jgi:hypothetical protein